MFRVGQKITYNMYKIEINKRVVAVSDNIITAMNSVPQLVADEAGIRNINCVIYNGIMYMPWGNAAKAVCAVGDEIFEVFISTIPTL